MEKLLFCFVLLVIKNFVFAQDGVTKEERELYTWGQGQEGIRVGIYKYRNDIQVGISLANTNITTNVFLPKFLLYRDRYADYSITLKDATGNEIPKTTEGKRQQKKLKSFHLSYWTDHAIERIGFLGQQPSDIGLFDVSKCFEIKKSGRYELEVQVVILKDIGDQQTYSPIELPSVKLPLNLLGNQ